MADGYKGIRITDTNKIRIWFTWKGERVYESLNRTATQSNLKHAARLRADIVKKIEAGIFDYADYFPSSPRATRQAQNSTSVFKLCENWLDSNQHLAKSTLLGYQKILNRYLIPHHGTQPVTSITHSDLQKIINSVEWKSNKTRNNLVSTLRGVFELAVLDQHITSNPANGLKFGKVQKPPPDPLSAEEVGTILDHLKAKEPDWLNYFQLAFLTGLRPSELIALKWTDVDWNMSLMRVQRAYVAQQIKHTKTAQVRDIELNNTAIAALKAQKPHTYLANGWIFLHPNTGNQINDNKPPRLVWDRTLKTIGIRHRNAYQTRHTFATLALMAGANPMWVAQQMGHKNMKMILEHYARWIQSADMGRNKSLLDNIITPNKSAQKSAHKGVTKGS